MPRFFVEPCKVSDEKIIIDTEDVSHITRVLRLGIGDTIRVCDTAGYDYTAEISAATDGRVECSILSKTKSNTEPNVCVTLYQGVPKGQKMDYIIEKTTELGITRIVPVTMSRCVVKFDSDKDKKKKCDRWQKVAVAAAKQSGRGIIPEVCLPITFDEALRQMKDTDLAVVPYECEDEAGLKPYLRSNTGAKSIAVMIGPEGGFDPKEIDKVLQSDIKTITLGKRILRTETAGEVTLALIMYELDEI